jgi:biotin carboxylase
MFWKKKHNKMRELQLFISIGAGFNQLPLILEAKKLGFNIIGVDQNASAAGFVESDIKIQESIANYEEIFKKIQELLLDGKVIGVLSRSYGPAIKTSAYLAEKLQIPYIPFKRVDDLTNKKKMKTILKKNKIPTPPYKLYQSSQAAKYKFPVVVKPNEGHAKAGVELIRNKTQLKEYTKNSGTNGKETLIEEYVEGDECIAIGITEKGIFHLIEITDKQTTEPPYFVDLKHSTPSRYCDKWSQIEIIGQKISQAFEIETSPLLIEFRIDPHDRLTVIETAAEFGGEFLSDILIPERTGYNIIRQTIRAITGEGFTPPINKKQRSSVVVQYITGQEGYLTSFNPIGPQNQENVLFSRIFKDIGSHLQNPHTNHDRLGVVITKGKTLELALANAEKAIANFDIKIKNKKQTKSKK